MIDILRELARAKAAFQLRALEAIIRGPASCDTHRNGEDATKIAAEFMSGAVDAEGSETPKTTSPPTGESV